MIDGRLRVVFDGHAITPRRSGIGGYSIRLCEALLAHCPDAVRLHIYAGSKVSEAREPEDVERAVSGVAEGSLYSPSHQLEIPRLVGGGSYDVFHTPDFLAPLFMRSTPVVITIHDVVPLAYPRLLARSKKTMLPGMFRAALRLSVRRAAAVITDSEFSRMEMQRLARIDAARVDVAPLAASLRKSERGFPPRFSDLFKASGYFLFVGRMEPYKGLSLLLDAYSRAALQSGEAFPDLVITGNPDPRYELSERMSASGARGRVHLTGYVDETELSALYTHALALVLPSLYEGFGFPVLDAMTHGTPVLCSNRASLPEVAGEAALMIDLEDQSVFAETLTRLFSDHDLRARLSKLGAAQAGRFSWKNTALKTAAIYERVACGRQAHATA